MSVPGCNALTRRGFVLSSAATLATAQRRGRPPNVILLMTDDQGFGDLSCHGNPWLKTPNLDKLHSESVRFVDHHSDPLCAPTRAGLLTGQYALRNGVTAATGGWSMLRPGAPTLPEMFRRNGYRTGMFGKWHLGENYPMRPSDRGFDESVYCRSGGIAQAADYWGNDYFDDHFYTQEQPKAYRGYCTDVFFGLAKQFIETHKSRPFFLYLPTNAPHDPFLVPDKYSQPFKTAGVPSPAAEFYGMIRNIDENVGALRGLLTRLGIEQDTIFLFMTDNGSSAGTARPQPAASGWSGYSAGMRAGKGAPYEGGHRVPLFLHWPGGGYTAGRDVHELTCHLDVFPTLVDLCGLRAPELEDIDGTSLLPLLRGEPRLAGERMHFIEHQQIRREGRFQMERPQPWINAVALSGKWRLVGGKELYNIVSDPGQQHDVSARNTEMFNRLKLGYARWRERMETGFRQWTRIPVGAAVNPVELTCFDWHGEVIPSSQAMVTSNLEGIGQWALVAEQDGVWEITLRQRPSYVPYTLEAERAAIWVNGSELTPRAVPRGSNSISFRCHVRKGNVNLSTELTDGTRRRSAYYTDVRYHAPGEGR